MNDDPLAACSIEALLALAADDFSDVDAVTRHMDATKAVIAEGFCPWCGGRLDDWLGCYAAVHYKAPNGGPIRWTRDGEVMSLPGITVTPLPPL